MNNKVHLPFWLFAFATIIALTLSVLVQDGMFMDAVLYTSVAHNEAIGIGTFWFPQYSTLNIAGLPSFHEQPPLVFGIVSLFFRAFGDSIYVERFYTLITLIVTMLLMRSLWNELYRNENRERKYLWIPYVLWIAIPCVYWAYSNNMCENTMGIFAMASVLLSYKKLERPTQFSKDVWGWVASGFFIFLATMSKGIPAFFPITVPFLYFLFVRRDKFAAVIVRTALLVGIPVAIYLVLFSLPVSGESLSMYLFKRALHRINNDPTVDYRLDVLFRIFSQLIPSLIIMLIIYAVARKQKAQQLVVVNRNALFFISVGLAASAPLMLTLVQKDIYLIPCFPYLAIGMAIIVLPAVVKWVEQLKDLKKIYKYILALTSTYLAVSLVVFYFGCGRVNRERETIHDVYLIGKIVPKFSTMTVPAEMYQEYNFILHGFLMRYDNISISPKKEYEYYLVEKNMKVNIPPAYKKLSLATQKYDLYKRQDTVGTIRNQIR